MSISVTLSVNGVERMEMLSVPRDADMRWLAHTVKEIAGVPEHLQRVSVVVRSLTLPSVFSSLQRFVQCSYQFLFC